MDHSLNGNTFRDMQGISNIADLTILPGSA
jgi:hypothetical protein